MLSRKSMLISCAAASALVGFGSSARAAIMYGATPIYGGGIYAGGTGNQGASEVLYGQTAGDGVGVGGSSQYSNSSFVNPTAPLRFDTNGVSQLPYLSPSVASFDGATANAIAGAGSVVAGTIIGSSNAYNSTGGSLGTRAVYWAPNATGPYSTTAVALGDDGTSNSGSTSGTAFTINAAGTIAGQMNAYNSAGGAIGTRAIRWDFGNTNASGTRLATELGNLGTTATGSTSSQVNSINAFNVSAGVATKYNSSGTSLGQHAVIWAAGQTSATELGNLGTTATGVTTLTALSINANGTATGYGVLYNASGTSLGNRGIVWDPSAYGTAIPLGNLGTQANGTTDNKAYSINSLGTAVGTGTKYNASGGNLGSRAIRWDASAYGTAVELGNLGTSATGSISTASAIAVNDEGLIVGQEGAYNSSGGSLGNRAVYWTPDGNVVDMNLLLSPADAANWILTNANAISSTDWVVGTGTYYPNGTGNSTGSYARSFLIQVAVPEPGSLGVIAMAGSMLMRRRRA